MQLSELMAGGVTLCFPLEGIDTQVEQCHLPGVCDSIFDLNSSHSLSFVVFKCYSSHQQPSAIEITNRRKDLFSIAYVRSSYRLLRHCQL